MSDAASYHMIGLVTVGEDEKTLADLLLSEFAQSLRERGFGSVRFATIPLEGEGHNWHDRGAGS